MKKTILFLFTFSIISNGLSQEPEISGTWFLEKMVIEDTTYPAPMPDLPSVNPQIGFHPNNIMSASIDDCNDFLVADIIYNDGEPTFTVTFTVYLIGKCTPGFPEYTSRYYQFLDTTDDPDSDATYTYSITEETNEIKTLIITDVEGNFAKYSSVMMPFFLYDTWELSSLTMDGNTTNIPDDDGSFVPTITFNETNNPLMASYSGDTGCNLFEGMNTYNLELDSYGLDSFNVTLSGECQSSEQYDIEGDYIEFLGSDLEATFEYEVMVTTNQKTLQLTKSNGDIALYNIEILDTPSYTEIDFTLFPNPASDQLFISSENNTIEKISIFNIAGQRISEQNANLETVNVSELQNGIYFIEITTENGKAVKQFIKE